MNHAALAKRPTHLAKLPQHKDLTKFRPERLRFGDETIVSMCSLAGDDIHEASQALLEIMSPETTGYLAGTAHPLGPCDALIVRCFPEQASTDSIHLIPVRVEQSGEAHRTASYTADKLWWLEKVGLGFARDAAQFWRGHCTDTCCLALYLGWGPSRLWFSENDTESLQRFSDPIMRFLRNAYKTRDALRRVAEPENEELVKLRWLLRKSPMRPLHHQLCALMSILGSDLSALFMEMGTGKTAVAIYKAFLEAKKKRSGIYKVIVACPNNIRLNWLEELKKFAPAPYRAIDLRGGRMDRIGKMVSILSSEPLADEKRVPKVAFAVIGYESAIGIMQALRAIPWDLGILDECHALKDTRTKRAKAFLEELRFACRSKLIMTGTPITNSPLDLFGQFEFLGPGFSGFDKWETFRKFYAKFVRTGRGYEKLDGYSHLPIMRERLILNSFCVTKAEVYKDLPPKVHDVLEVEFSPGQAILYKKTLDRIIIEIEQDLLSGGLKDAAMIIKNALTRLMRLAQITAGIVKVDRIGDDGVDLSQFLIQCPKVQLLFDELNATPRNEKVIVWSCFVRPIDEIAAVLGDSCVKLHGKVSLKKREESIKAFNSDPNVRFLIANPSVASQGLNLLGYTDPKQKTNCARMIYYSQNWSMLSRAQSEDRSHRHGTRVPLRITDLVIPNTVDVEIRETIMVHRELAHTLQDVSSLVSRLREFQT